jgi:hypothetical protein
MDGRGVQGGEIEPTEPSGASPKVICVGRCRLSKTKQKNVTRLH